MELPHLGENCSEPTCKKLDFLPMKCDACHGTFCLEHYTYAKHACPCAYQKDVQVPVCPLCSRPVATQRGQPPDVAVSAHIDSDCMSDGAQSRRKVFTNRCSVRGCRTKEVVPVVCTECTFNYCFKHRHPIDHKCEGKPATAALRKNGAVSRQRPQNDLFSTVQGSMDEDEAFARALALSLQDEQVQASGVGMSQEQLDAELARHLQQQPPTRTTNTSSRDRCNVS